MTISSDRRSLFWLFIAVLFFGFISLIHSILLPFVLGMFMAYFLDPAADRLERHGWSRNTATAVITVTFFVGTLLLLLLVVPVIASQLTGLIAALPQYISTLQQDYADDFSHWLGGIEGLQMDSIKDAVSQFSGVAIKVAEQFATGLFHSGMAIFNLLSLLLVTPIVAFYMLRDWDKLVARLDTYLPRPYAPTIRAQFTIIDQTLAGFIRGQLNVCLILATYYAIALSLVGLKFGILIGLMTGMLIILPYVGALFGTLTGVGVAFFQFSSYSDIGMVAGVFVCGQFMESYFLTPRMVGERVGLHPVWVIFGMLAGAALFGFVGVLLAVPATAVIGVLIRFALERYLHSSYYGAPIIQSESKVL